MDIQVSIDVDGLLEKAPVQNGLKRFIEDVSDTSLDYSTMRAWSLRGSIKSNRLAPILLHHALLGKRVTMNDLIVIKVDGKPYRLKDLPKRVRQDLDRRIERALADPRTVGR